MKYRFLEHTADMKFQAFGKTLEQAFENSVLAVSSHLSGEKPVKSSKKKKVKLEGNDKKSLFYNLLDEVIFLLDAESFLVSKAKINIKENTLNIEFSGDDASKYNIDEIKAATYAEMEIKQTKDGWQVQAVMDI